MKPRGRTNAQNLTAAQQTRAEEEAAYRKLYGKLLPDVQYLQRRGHTVYKERSQIMLDGRPITAEELQARARREREKAGDQPAGEVRKVVTTVSGLRVGDKVEVYKQQRSEAASRPLSAVKEKLTGAALAAKSKAEKTSDDLGPTPRLEWLPLDQLEIDRRYQRQMGPGNWAHANRILREWKWLFYQPIVVAPKQGGAGYVVIDGQHRLEAARKHPAIDRLPCYVVDAADVADQAKAFVTLNARRIGVTRLQRFWAAHAAGEPVARRIHKICEAAGVAITKSGGVLPPRTTIATFTIEKLLPIGGGHITTALKVLAETHGDTADVFKSAPIFALVQIVAGKDFDRERLVRVMRKADLDQVMGAAKSWRAQNGGTMEKAVERELRALYEPQLRRVA